MASSGSPARNRRSSSCAARAGSSRRRVAAARRTASGSTRSTRGRPELAQRPQRRLALVRPGRRSTRSRRPPAARGPARERSRPPAPSAARRLRRPRRARRPSRRGSSRRTAAAMVGRIQQHARRGRRADRVQPQLELVATPRLPPPPRVPQNRSGCSGSERSGSPVGGDELDRAAGCRPRSRTCARASRSRRRAISPPRPVVDIRPPVDGEPVLLRGGVELAPGETGARRGTCAPRDRPRSPSSAAGRS